MAPILRRFTILQRWTTGQSVRILSQTPSSLSFSAARTASLLLLQFMLLTLGDNLINQMKVSLDFYVETFICFCCCCCCCWFICPVTVFHFLLQGKSRFKRLWPKAFHLLYFTFDFCVVVTRTSENGFCCLLLPFSKEHINENRYIGAL